MIALLRVLERVHGHLGWLGVAALLHPAVLLRNPKRRAPLAVALATALVAGAGLLGGFLYPSYRTKLKQHIFATAPRVGLLFERKEHLAVGAIFLALAGCVAHLSLRAFTDGPAANAVARLAHRAFLLAFLLALVVAVFGVAVASYESF